MDYNSHYTGRDDNRSFLDFHPEYDDSYEKESWKVEGFEVVEMTAHEQAIEWAMKVEKKNAIMLAALKEIAKCEGAFSIDPLSFASNTIENMKGIADAAIAKVKEADNDNSR